MNAIELENRVLRYHREPSRFWTDREVHVALTSDPQGYARFVHNELELVARGMAKVEMPPKMIFDDRAMGDFRIMPCVLRLGEKTRKTVKIVGTNRSQMIVPDKITVGRAFLLDSKENFISQEFEACALSSARTGVCAAVAAKALDAHTGRVAMIGSGRVGYYAALYLCSQNPVGEVIFIDEVESRAHAACQALACRCPGTRFIAGGGVQDADLLILATSSSSPVCHPDQTRASVVISLGADTDDQHELDSAWQGCADIFVESLDSLRYGDLKLWGIKASQVTELESVLASGVGSISQRRIFISTGSALYDNLTIGYLTKDDPCRTGPGQARCLASCQ